MQCARCGHVQPGEADAWDCPHCGTTNRKAYAPATKLPEPTGTIEAPRRPTDARPRPRPRAAGAVRPRPAGVAIAETDAEFVAVYRWFSWRHLALALGAAVLALIALTWLPALRGFAAGGLLLAASAYLALVTLLNRTTIRATREVLQARHGPVPIIGGDAMDAFGFWPDVRDAWAPTPRLLWVAKAERELVDLADADVTPTKMYLKAAHHDGAGVVEIQLLPSSAPEPVEDFIGLALDAWLARAELPFYKDEPS